MSDDSEWMQRAAIAPTEMRYWVPGQVKRIPAWHGEHFWTIAAHFEVTDPASLAPGQPWHMEAGNLVLMEPLRCYYCFEQYVPHLTSLPCLGIPDPKELRR